MVRRLRSHAKAASDMYSSTKYATSPQWIQDLDPSNETDALALRSIFDPRCQIAKESCNRCSYLRLECLVSPHIPSHCVACFARGDDECMTRLSGIYDGDTEIDEDDDVITSATRRQRRKTGSYTTSAATETTKAQMGNSQNALDNGPKLSKTTSLPGIVSTSASAPGKDAISEERASNAGQQSRLSIQIKQLENPRGLTLNDLKRKRPKPDTTGRSLKKVRRTINAVEPSSIESRQSPEHNCLKVDASIEAATTKAAQTVSAVEPLSTHLHHHPKNERLQSTTPPMSATEAAQTANATGPSSDRSHQSQKRNCIKSETSTEAAAEAKHNPLRAASSSSRSDPIPKPLETPNPNIQSSSTHEAPVPSILKMSMSTKKQNNTTLWISIPSSTDAVPLTLRSCRTMPSLFHSVFKICGLAEQQQQQDKVLGLRTSLEWTQNVGVKEYLMLKRDFEDIFDVFLRIIDALPCWEQEDGCCSVAIEVVMMA